MEQYLYYNHSLDEKGIFILNNLIFPLNSQLDFFPYEKHFKDVGEIRYKEYLNDSLIQYHFQEKTMFNDIKQNLFYYYNYYFLKMLHTLIQYNTVDYFFSDVNNSCFNYININEPSVLCSNTWRPNNYLSDPEQKFIKLSNDILKNGMFFPFYVEKRNNNRIVLCGGTHRFISLKHNPQAQNKQFLFIDITQIGNLLGKHKEANQKLIDIKNAKFSILQNLYLLADNSIYIAKTDNVYLYYLFFKIMTEKIVFYLNKYPNTITPSPVFNNEKAWNAFINSPFKKIPALENFQ